MIEVVDRRADDEDRDTSGPCDVLRAALHRAERGDVDAAMVVTVHGDDVTLALSAGVNPVEALGALEALKLTILGYEGDE